MSNVKPQERHKNSPPENDIAARRAAMAILARATRDELKIGLETAACSLDCQPLRAPEIGLVMARGRISGTGQPFNLGEVSVTRAAVRLPNAQEGFAYLLGRDIERAHLAAIADAHWQDAQTRPSIETHLIQPVHSRLTGDKTRRREEAAATQVDFFTMVRGED